MSTLQLFTIVCDDCGRHGPVVKTNFTWARKEARSEGWSTNIPD